MTCVDSNTGGGAKCIGKGAEGEAAEALGERRLLSVLSGRG